MRFTAGPKSFSEEALQVDQFIMRGGTWCLCHQYKTGHENPQSAECVSWSRWFVGALWGCLNRDLVVDRMGS